VHQADPDSLSDNPDNPLYLETIPRHGYRFLAPVRTKLVPAPPPQIKEASSGLIANVANQVRDRVQAATHAAPSGPTQPTEDIGSPTTQAASPVPPSTASVTRSRLLWTLVPGLVLLAVLLYWLLSRTGR